MFHNEVLHAASRGGSICNMIAVLNIKHRIVMCEKGNQGLHPCWEEVNLTLPERSDAT
jgi:hypothetical protein